MPAIPPFVLKKLYVTGSLRTEDDGFALDLKNSIAPAVITAFTGLEADSQVMGLTQVTLVLPNGDPRATSDISDDAPLSFPLNTTITLHVVGQTLEPGPHEFIVHVVVQQVGPLDIPISDTLA